MSERESGLRAFVDESLSNRVYDPHTYILAAALCEETVLDDVRASVSQLRLRGQVKVHWHDDDMRRPLIAKTVAALPLRHLIVIRTGTPGGHLERQRQKCLESLLRELHALDVVDVTFESRGLADDRRDRNTTDGLPAGSAGDLRTAARRTRCWSA